MWVCSLFAFGFKKRMGGLTGAAQEMTRVTLRQITERQILKSILHFIESSSYIWK